MGVSSDSWVQVRSDSTPPMVNRIDAGCVSPSAVRPTVQGTPARAQSAPSPVASTATRQDSIPRPSGVEATMPLNRFPSIRTSTACVCR